MVKIKYETNEGSCIYEIENNLIEENIEAELETAKHEYMRHGIDYDYTDGIDSEGYPYTEIWECDGDGWIRWTVLG